MRAKNATRNVKVMMIAFVLQTVLSFAYRTVFIRVLGGEYLGLDSLFLNVISILSVAELGVGVAIAYCMYKPAADNDIERLKSLNYLYKKIYRYIIVIVLFLGLMVIPFLPLFIGAGSISPVNIYVVYLLFLSNALISYIAAHRRTLIFVFQRNDIISKIGIIATSLSISARIGILLLTRNYYLVVSLVVLFTVLESLLIIVVSHKMFPEIRGKGAKVDRETKRGIAKNVYALLFHRIGGIVVLSSVTLQISIFFGLEMVALVSNYMLLIGMAGMIFSILISSVQASIGNMIAKEGVDKNYKIFKILKLGSWIITGLFAVVFITVINPFITVWIGLDWTLGFWFVMLFSVKFLVNNMRAITCMYNECNGLLYNDRYKPLLEIIVFWTASLILIQHIGVNGIFLAGIISSLAVCIWIESYVAHKNYFKRSMIPYMFSYFSFLLITLGVIALAHLSAAIIPVKWYYLPIIGTIATVITGVIYTSVYWFSNERKDILNLFAVLRKKKI